MPDAKPKCFIIMPVSTPPALVPQYGGDSEHFRHVLEHLFTPAVEQAGFEAMPPVASGADIIHAEIIKKLETADLVLCDLSAENPNVFFELGIRTAVDKPIALVKDQFLTRVPFDTTLINHHAYDGSLSAWTIQKEIASLATHVQNAVTTSGGRNTMWKVFGLTTRAQPASAGTPDDKLDLLIRQVESLAREQMSRDEFRPNVEPDDVPNELYKFANDLLGAYDVELASGRVENLSFYLTVDKLPSMRVTSILKRRFRERGYVLEFELVRINDPNVTQRAVNQDKQHGSLDVRP